PGLLLGCAIAMAKLDALSPRAIRGIGIAGAGITAYLVVLSSGTTRPETAYFTLPLAELGGAMLLVGASSLPLQHPTLVRVGVLSYGIYLWHFPISVALRDQLTWGQLAT